MTSIRPSDDVRLPDPEDAPLVWARHPSLGASPTPLPVRRGSVVRRSFGYSHDRRRIVEEEAQAIRDAAQRVLDGATLSSVVKAWNVRGLRTAAGGPWRVNSLSSLLVRPRLAGLGSDSRPLPPGQFPPILDVGTHARLVALHHARRKRSRRPTRRYLLTGLLRCWRCGGGLRGTPATRGSDLYVCPGPPHGGCSGTAVTADHADGAVRDLVLARLDSAELRRAPSIAEPQADHDAAVRAAALELKWHRQRLQELAEMWATGQISQAEWLSLRRSVSRRAAEAEIQVERLARTATLRKLAGAGAVLRAQWPSMASKERRAVVRAVLECVVVLAADPPRRVFQPERLRPVWAG